MAANAPINALQISKTVLLMTQAMEQIMHQSGILFALVMECVVTEFMVMEAAHVTSVIWTQITVKEHHVASGTIHQQVFCLQH